MRCGTTLLSCLMAVSAMPALADAIPYGNPGTIAPQVNTYASSSSGLGLYFLGYSAYLNDSIDVYDVQTGYNSGLVMDNETTPLGMEYTVGATPGQINAGDQIVFFIDSPAGIFASVAAGSSDGVNHAYITPYSGGVVGGNVVPSGLYVGMEDLPNGASDFDYNDDTFVVTGVTTGATPEPGSLALLGTGMLAGVGMMRRRKSSMARA